MNRLLSVRYIATAIVLMMWLPSFAQQSYTLSGSQQFTVSGTSTIHDWDMVATEKIAGVIKLTSENAKLNSIQALTINLPVQSLKSGKSAMDKNTYEALVEDKYPTIKFEMTEFISVKGNVVQIKGKLTIAGTSKTIPLTATYTQSSNAISFKGSFDILLTDYNVQPPTAVFGTIKTGNELTLKFESSFSPNK